MTTSNKNLKEKIQPIVESRLKEYEKYHPLNDEERALVKLIITSIVLNEKLKKSIAINHN